MSSLPPPQPLELSYKTGFGSSTSFMTSSSRVMFEKEKDGGSSEEVEIAIYAMNKKNENLKNGVNCLRSPSEGGSSQGITSLFLKRRSMQKSKAQSHKREMNQGIAFSRPLRDLSKK
ncbi:hypothetical protein H6P81_003144 [Aristolochia fimbriata]|uniref:Uncharacterized protein n=1 Tax=Aristolochia fimbriata TaxID=158543 RepID=A0AAV7FEX7_ARIFI|nr:hypothetical protein H6P81_003144 [Aristolochia fimbriata]